MYEFDSNEELDRLLAMSPVYNFATYQVLPLAEMSDPGTVVGK
jgi:muconolactone delta-isomerase